MDEQTDAQVFHVLNRTSPPLGPLPKKESKTYPRDVLVSFGHFVRDSEIEDVAREVVDRKQRELMRVRQRRLKGEKKGGKERGKKRKERRKKEGKKGGKKQTNKRMKSFAENSVMAFEPTMRP